MHCRLTPRWDIPAVDMARPSFFRTEMNDSCLCPRPTR